MNKYKSRIALAKTLMKIAIQQGDPKALAEVMNKIMSFIDSTDLKAVQAYVAKKMDLDAETTKEAYNIFVKNFYENVLKEEQSSAVERAKKRVSDTFHISYETQAKINNGMVKQADANAAWDKVKHMSTMELVSNAINFVTQYKNIKEVAETIARLANDININPPTPPAAGLAVASLSEKVGKATGLMLFISFLLTIGAAGTSDLASKIPPAMTQNDEFRAIVAMLSSWGVTGILGFLSNLFKNRENKQNKPKYYQGPSF